MSDMLLSCVAVEGIQENFLLLLRGLLSSQNILIKSEKKNGLEAIELKLNIPSASRFPKEDLLDLCRQFRTDLGFLENEQQRHFVKLIVFDMDSTLIQNEVIDEMALIFGIGEQVKKITEKAMNGEIEFNEALRERVSLLRGLKEEELLKVLENLKVTPGVRVVIHEAKKRGIKTAIVSGGFHFFAEHFQEKLGIDYVRANQLEFLNGQLSGKLLGKIVNAEEKATLLDEFARKEKITLDQIMAVGDGANDLLMLSKAGLGVAFHAKEKVKEKTDLQINFGPMSVLLYYLGIPGNHLDETF
jgi:phosphoserine phosphatase